MEETARAGRPVRTVQWSYRQSNSTRGRGIQRSSGTKRIYPRRQRYLKSKDSQRSQSRFVRRKGRLQTSHHHNRKFMKARSSTRLTSPKGPRSQGVQENSPRQTKENAEKQVSRATSCSTLKTMPSETSKSASHTKSVPSDFPVPLDAQKENSDNDKSSPNGNNDSVNGSRRKRCRRKRKAGDHHQVGRTTRWKPYDMLTWEERQALDEKETKRATTRREEQMANGQPMAPYNTTQFLMEQHAVTSTPPDLRAHVNSKLGVKVVLPRDRKPSGSLTAEESESLTTDDNYSSVGGVGAETDGVDDYETIFLQKDFADAYNNFRAERLEALTREELMREYLDMEAKLESVYARLNEMHSCNGDNATNVSDKQDPVVLVHNEMERLRNENAKLIKEVEQSKKQTTTS